MNKITKPETANNRTRDLAILLESSRKHIGNIAKALAFFTRNIIESTSKGDYDKLTGIDRFLKHVADCAMEGMAKSTNDGVCELFSCPFCSGTAASEIPSRDKTL